MSDPDERTSLDDDDHLVRQAKVDREAFGRLFDRYYERVLRFAARRLGNRTLAEDVTSEAFLQVAAHLHEFPGQTESEFRRWLFRIAVNAANAQARQRHRRDQLLADAVHGGQLAPSSASPTNIVEDRLAWEQIERALGSLDERDQTIIHLRYFGQLSAEEIGAVVDASAGGVRTALSRALARLRKCLATERSKPKP